MPTASVIIPTFNRASLVQTALESVLNQTFTDFELIIVDDGGKDNTEQLVTNYRDPRIKYVKRVNGGISAARNTGLSVATGEWITFLDDDDEAFVDWLSVFNELLSEAKVGIACVGVIQNSNGLSREVLPRQLKPIYESAFGLFMAGSFACRAALLHEIAGFAEGLTCSHATELAMRLIPVCHRRGLTVKSSLKILVQINRHNPLNRPMSSPECLLKGVNYILETHGDLLKRCPDAISRYLSIAAVASARMGLYSDCRKFLVRSLRTNPWSLKNYLRLVLSLNRRLADHAWKYGDFRSDAF